MLYVWALHVQVVMNRKPEGRKRNGRAELRWIDEVLEDIKKLGAKNWWTVASDWEVWR
jgi:hypothetical protein